MSRVGEAGGGRGDARVAGRSTRRRLDNPGIVEIRPEPSPAEREAILIVLDQMLGATPRDELSPRSAWAFAGRRESLLGSNGGSLTGWGRGWDRSADW